MFMLVPWLPFVLIAYNLVRRLREIHLGTDWTSDSG
jgi:hypothetical protein